METDATAEHTDDRADAEPAVPPSVADGITHSLDPRYVQQQRIAGYIAWGIILAGGFLSIVITALAAPLRPVALIALIVAWLALAIALIWLSYRWPAVEHRHTSYTVDGRGIEIRKGVVWRVVINVPRSRVQHTDVSQGPLERHFGLGTLVIYTAGTDHAKVDLAGLEHGTALRIRDHLLPKEGEDAV
jgi:uncharacterized protein